MVVMYFFLNYTQICIRRGGEKPSGSYKSGETIGFGWHLQVVSKNSHHRFVKKKKNEFAIISRRLQRALCGYLHCAWC